MNDYTKDLGRFVIAKERADGTHRVLMSVPKHLRPSGWPASIQLPELGRRRASLSDPVFKQRVINDAMRLNASLDERRARNSLAGKPGRRSAAEIAEIYFKRDSYQLLSKSRRDRNRYSVLTIVDWSASRGHPDMSSLTAMDIDDFLSMFNDRPFKRFDMRSVWRCLFETAVYAGWIQKSPLPNGKWNTPKPKKVSVWKWEDVTRYSTIARQMEQPGLAAMITTMMEVGQRPGDMQQAQWGRDYFGDQFVIRQSKTGSTVNIPVSQDIRDMIEAVRIEGSPYLFNDFDTGTGFTHSRLMQRFNEVRHAATDEGGELLYMRSLRHSCVCQKFEAGCTIAEIAGITGHLLARVHTILERYYPDRERLAELGMRRSFAARGGDPTAFGDVRTMPASDWGGASPRRYSLSNITERNAERLLANKRGQRLRVVRGQARSKVGTGSK